MTVSGMARLFDDANEFMFAKTINIMYIDINFSELLT